MTKLPIKLVKLKMVPGVKEDWKTILKSYINCIKTT